MIDKIQQLDNAKNENDEAFDKEIKEISERYHIELEEKKNQYSQKMLEDAARY